MTFVASVATSVAAAPTNHDVAFWRAIVDARYAPPAGEEVATLTVELTEMLASTDPERRDDIAYSTVLLSNEPSSSEASVAAHTALRAALKPLF